MKELNRIKNVFSKISIVKKSSLEEFNIDYGILTGISFGVTEKIGFRIVLHYGLEDVWKKPIEQRSITTILTGVNIYFNL